MDCVFGASNFRNEIIWWYRKFGQGGKNYKKNHDVILYYAKHAANVTFIPQFEDFSPKSQVDKYKRHLIDGRWVQDKNVLMKDIRKNDGVVMSNTWEISFIHSQSKERLGYPTQKPLALVERIIKASSNKGDIVLDPFCGCGTTAEAAYTLDRKLIGIDISPYAITRVCHDRLKHAEGIAMQGLPTDLGSARMMAKNDPFYFEQWAVTTLPGCVANAGQFDEGARSFNRMLFWSMEEHFAEARLQLPAMAHPRTGKALQQMIPVG